MRYTGLSERQRGILQMDSFQPKGKKKNQKTKQTKNSQIHHFTKKSDV